MTSRNQKKIDALKRQIAELEAVESRDSGILKGIYAELQEKLKSREVTFESFVRFAQRDVRKAIAKMDREAQEAAEGGAPAGDEAPKKRGRGGRPAGSGKKAAGAAGAKKKPARKRGAKAENIKIAPGRYTSVPPDMEKVFDIKEKGARPKAVKEYAMQIGLEAFNAQCRMAE